MFKRPRARHNRYQVTGIVVSLSLLGPWFTARAGNDDEILLGNDAALMGGAVTAITASGSALWYNPAGLARADLDAFDVSAQALTMRLVSIDNLLVTPGGESADGNYSEFLAIPSALTYLRRLGARTALAIGIFVPRFNNIDMRSTLDTSDPLPARWLVTARDTLSRYHFTAGLGWSLGSAWQVGLSAALIYETELDSVQYSGAELGESDNPSFIALTRQSSRQSLGFEFRGGAQWAPHPHWRLGLAIQTPGVFFGNSADEAVILGGLLDNPDTGPAGGGEIEIDEDLAVDVEVLSPARFRLGVAHTWRRLTFSLDGDLQLGLSNEVLEIQRGLTWNLRAGGMVALDERLSFGLGLFTDRNPFRGSAETKVDFYGFSGGVRYTNIRELAAKEKQQRIYFSTTLALRYAYGNGETGALELPEQLDVDPFDLQDRVTNVTIHELSLHIGSALYF